MAGEMKMDVREKLVKLLKTSPTRNGYTDLGDIADHLIANGVVVLPCKDGTTVCRVENNTEACHTCEYYSYGCGEAFCLNGEDEVRDYPEIAEKPICEKQFMEVKDYTPKLDWIFEHRDDFGKTVFLTREEAEASLRKMKEHK